MYRILRNTFLTSRTGLKTTITLDEDTDESLLPVENTTPESSLLDQASREMVQQALMDLPVPFREILLLCEVEEMSYQEIAETLGIPMGTVMSRLYRARQALRDLLRKKNAGVRHGV
jgi:RNA polymerase sigma-70 factor (ECF subfamily)